jgi:hypothetical protein
MPTRKEPEIIKHPGELKSLSVLPIKLKHGQRRVSLSALLAAEGRSDYESKINRRLFACGCTESALGIILGLSVYIVWAVFRSGEISVIGHIGSGLAAFFAGSVLGKIVGLIRAEKHLKETIQLILLALPKNGPWDQSPLPGDPQCY